MGLMLLMVAGFARALIGMVAALGTAGQLLLILALGMAVTMSCGTASAWLNLLGRPAAAATARLEPAAAD
jgi:hypothetical protein